MLRCSLNAKYTRQFSKYIWEYIERNASALSAKRVSNSKSLGLQASSAPLNCYRPFSSRTPTKSPPPEAFDAVRRLSSIFAKGNTPIPEPEESPRSIKALYITCKKYEQLYELSPDALSSLISLFGSLSTLSTLPSSAILQEHDTYAFHPLAQQLHSKFPGEAREQWAFALEIANDKRGLGQTLDRTDHFWLMRAALQDLKKLARQEALDDDLISRSRSRARKNYFLINPAAHEWIIHKVYLEGLLELGEEKAADEVIGRLSRILKWTGGLHHRLVAILWRVLAVPGKCTTPTTKSHFLTVLRERVNRLHDDMHDVAQRPSNSGMVSEVDHEDRRSYEALALRSYLTDIVFSRNPGSNCRLHHLRSVYSWAVFEARAALGAFNDGTYANAREADEAAWNNLVLLSLSSPQARLSQGLGLISLGGAQGMQGVDSQGQVLGWTVICALSALVSEVGRSYKDQAVSLPQKDVQELARTLWMLWRKEESWRAGAVMRSKELVCSAAASFMTLASFSGDERLADAVLRHTRTVVVYPAKFEKQPLDHSMLEILAVQYASLYAWPSPPDQIWKHLSDVLHKAELIPSRQEEHSRSFVNAVASGLLRNMARVDPISAFHAYQSTAGASININEPTIVILAKTLISRGHLESALSCLREEAISCESLQEIFDLLVKQTLRTQEELLEKGLATALSSFITKTSLIPSNEGDLNRLLFAYIRSGYLIEALNIVKRPELSDSTNLLRSKSLERFMSSLVSRRHHRLLGKFLKTSWARSPAQLSPLLRQSRFQYLQRLLSQAGDEITEGQIVAALPFSVYIWPHMKAHIPFHPRLASLDRTVLSLKLSSSLASKKQLDNETLERAVHMLLNVGRGAAAMKIANRYSPKISTKLGNIMLSASLFPRHARPSERIVRHASNRLSQLVKTRGFIPDRVTVNIVIRALLRWKGLPSVTTLRALFDQVILSGYPGLREYSSSLPVVSSADPASQRNVLFGDQASTAKTRLLPLDVNAFSKNISFARHTRPLYKMFMKALKEKGDIEGARGVRHILDGQRDQILRRIHARRAGRVRARLRKRKSQAPQHIS